MLGWSILLNYQMQNGKEWPNKKCSTISWNTQTQKSLTEINNVIIFTVFL